MENKVWQQILHFHTLFLLVPFLQDEYEGKEKETHMIIASQSKKLLSWTGPATIPSTGLMESSIDGQRNSVAESYLGIHASDV